MFGEFTLFKCLVKKVWRMNRSAKGLLIVTINLEGFSLANCRRFAKIAKLSCYMVILITRPDTGVNVYSVLNN